ncbi:hypothetical protein AB751O23_AA_00530 [Chlamydiales bacterium SCGC AB-751-O23]|jgi:hypothetical protein|nr:hypothetical protein AB751O23_AA_00530 [Chlamydiales bacterium SCGC AB-751-O23]
MSSLLTVKRTNERNLNPLGLLDTDRFLKSYKRPTSLKIFNEAMEYFLEDYTNRRPPYCTRPITTKEDFMSFIPCMTQHLSLYPTWLPLEVEETRRKFIRLSMQIGQGLTVGETAVFTRSMLARVERIRELFQTTKRVKAISNLFLLTKESHTSKPSASSANNPIVTKENFLTLDESAIAALEQFHKTLSLEKLVGPSFNSLPIPQKLYKLQVILSTLSFQKKAFEESKENLFNFTHSIKLLEESLEGARGVICHETNSFRPVFPVPIDFLESTASTDDFNFMLKFGGFLFQNSTERTFESNRIEMVIKSGNIEDLETLINEYKIFKENSDLSTVSLQLLDYLIRYIESKLQVFLAARDLKIFNNAFHRENDLMQGHSNNEDLSKIAPLLFTFYSLYEQACQCAISEDRCATICTPPHFFFYDVLAVLFDRYQKKIDSQALEALTLMTTLLSSVRKINDKKPLFQYKVDLSSRSSSTPSDTTLLEDVFAIKSTDVAAQRTNKKTKTAIKKAKKEKASLVKSKTKIEAPPLAEEEEERDSISSSSESIDLDIEGVGAGAGATEHFKLKAPKSLSCPPTISIAREIGKLCPYKLSERVIRWTEINWGDDLSGGKFKDYEPNMFPSAKFREQIYHSFGLELILRSLDYNLNETSEWITEKGIKQKRFCIIAEITYPELPNSSTSKKVSKRGIIAITIGHDNLIYHLRFQGMADTEIQQLAITRSFHGIDFPSIEESIFLQETKNEALYHENKGTGTFMEEDRIRGIRTFKDYSIGTTLRLLKP